MSHLNDILEIERNRIENGPPNSVYLFQEGTFLRAYEWSAWLCCRYINDFKVTKREVNNDLGNIVMVGFPVNSLQKFTPEKAEVINHENGSIEMVLPLELLPFGYGMPELLDDFNNWKQSIPMPKPSSKSIIRELKRGDANNAEKPQHLTEVMMRLVAFPIEQKSPIDCMVFLAELKQQLATLL